MKDPYEEVFKIISDAIKKQTDMIAYIAKHTLTVSDYEDFMERFRTDKKDSDDQIIK